MRRSTVNRHLRKTPKGLKVVRKHQRKVKSTRRVENISSTDFLQDPQTKVINDLKVEKVFINTQIDSLKDREKQLKVMKKENNDFAKWLKKRIGTI